MIAREDEGEKRRAVRDRGDGSAIQIQNCPRLRKSFGGDVRLSGQGLVNEAVVHARVY